MALLFGFTVVSVEEEAALHVEFDPAGNVDDNWEAVQTAIRDNAVPANVPNEFEPGADGRVATDDYLGWEAYRHEQRSREVLTTRC